MKIMNVASLFRNIEDSIEKLDMNKKFLYSIAFYVLEDHVFHYLKIRANAMSSK